ncbi:MAG: helix-turn-helix transcriptional regulator [Flavobacterium sp.]|nr:helix-turn-helix transcriptional regulator [Flavobacterium sp.]
MTETRQVQNKTMTLGQKIKELRENAGLKQRELAFQLGIGEGYLSKVEHDQKPLKREDLTKLNELFSTPIEELESLWLANKVYSIVRDEESALLALKVAEEQVKYKKFKNA